MNFNDFSKLKLDPKRTSFFLGIVKYHKEKKCPFCKQKFDNGILIERPKEIVSLFELLSPKWIIHCKNTHGALLYMIFQELGIKIPKEIEKYVI